MHGSEPLLIHPVVVLEGVPYLAKLPTPLDVHARQFVEEPPVALAPVQKSELTTPAADKSLTSVAASKFVHDVAICTPVLLVTCTPESKLNCSGNVRGSSEDEKARRAW